MKAYKIVQVGCGHMAHAWVAYALAREDCQIVAICELDVDKGKAYAARYKLVAPVYEDLAQAIRETGANLVFNVSIPNAHLAITSTALENGCAVFSEKPMADDIQSAKQLAKLAQDLHKPFFVMQNRRYVKHLRNIKAFMDTGVAGRPEFICADFFKGTHFRGFTKLMESPLLIDMAIHTFDQCRYLTGAKPVSVYCHEFKPENTEYAGNAAAVCVFEMDDGAVFCYRGSWSHEGLPTSWESQWRIGMTLGTITWDGENAPQCQIPQWPVPLTQQYATVYPAVIPDVYGGRVNHAGCLDEFFAALAQGRDAETCATDNIHSVKMVFGAVKSAKEGRKVMMDEL